MKICKLCIGDKEMAKIHCTHKENMCEKELANKSKMSEQENSFNLELAKLKHQRDILMAQNPDFARAVMQQEVELQKIQSKHEQYMSMVKLYETYANKKGVFQRVPDPQDFLKSETHNSRMLKNRTDAETC